MATTAIATSCFKVGGLYWCDLGNSCKYDVGTFKTRPAIFLGLAVDSVAHSLIPLAHVALLSTTISNKPQEYLLSVIDQTASFHPGRITTVPLRKLNKFIGMVLQDDLKAIYNLCRSEFALGQNGFSKAFIRRGSIYRTAGLHPFKGDNGSVVVVSNSTRSEKAQFHAMPLTEHHCISSIRIKLDSGPAYVDTAQLRRLSVSNLALSGNIPQPVGRLDLSHLRRLDDALIRSLNLQ